MRKLVNWVFNTLTNLSVKLFFFLSFCVITILSSSC